MAAPTRKPATRRHGDEAVPFFDETRIPVDVIELPAPEIDGLAPEDYELIRHQENSRLALRAIPVGRRNGLFCWTELGARHVGILQSWIVTCRLHQIDPCDYPVDVLQRLGQPPANRVHELTPRGYRLRSTRRAPEWRSPRVARRLVERPRQGRAFRRP